MNENARSTQKWGQIILPISVLALFAFTLLAKVILRRQSATPTKDPQNHKLSWSEQLNRPVSALPVDIFRILVGLLSFLFFKQLRVDAKDYSGPKGLIDHQLSRRIFWYTKLNPLFPGLPLSFFKSLYGAAMALALLLATGFWPRLSAALLFLISVMAYRWHFLVANVEDGVMHLVLFWTFLMPIGKTLTLPGLWHNKQNALAIWRQQFVPGATIRTFLGNIALVYLAAGLWKWTSRMWRQGLALFAALKTPVSRAPTFWQRRHLVLLIPGNFFALFIEPLLALMIFLPADYWLKWILAAGALVLHFGISVAMYIPFANIALEAAMVLVFRNELASFFKAHPVPATVLFHEKLTRAGRLGIGLLTIFVVAALWEIRHPEWRVKAFRSDGILYRFAERIHLNPRLGHHQNPMYAILWILGFAQSYRLFDWIDERNHFVIYKAIENHLDGTAQSIDPADILPGGLRGALITSYIHGVPWMKVKPDDLEALRQSLFERIADRYVQSHPNVSQVSVYASVQRTTAENLDLNQGHYLILFRFEGNQGKAKILETAPLPEMRFD